MNGVGCHQRAVRGHKDKLVGVSDGLWVIDEGLGGVDHFTHGVGVLQSEFDMFVVDKDKLVLGWIEGGSTVQPEVIQEGGLEIVVCMHEGEDLLVLIGQHLLHFSNENVEGGGHCVRGDRVGEGAGGQEGGAQE